MSDKGYEPSKEEVFKESVRVTSEVGWREMRGKPGVEWRTAGGIT